MRVSPSPPLGRKSGVGLVLFKYLLVRVEGFSETLGKKMVANTRVTVDNAEVEVVATTVLCSGKDPVLAALSYRDPNYSFAGTEYVSLNPLFQNKTPCLIEAVAEHCSKTLPTATAEFPFRSGLVNESLKRQPFRVSHD